MSSLAAGRPRTIFGRIRRSKAVWIGIALGTLVAIGASIVAALTFSAGAPAIPLLNLPVPTFKLQSVIPGEPGISSARFRGASAVVLNFWGSWCPPCTAETPALEAAHRSLGRQVTFVGIDEEDTRSAAIRFLHRVGITYPSGFDGHGAVGSAFQIHGTPTTYFISHGRMLDFHQGGLSEGEILISVRQIFGIR